MALREWFDNRRQLRRNAVSIFLDLEDRFCLARARPTGKRDLSSPKTLRHSRSSSARFA